MIVTQSYGFEDGHEMKRMKQHRHWMLKSSLLRSSQSPSLWQSKYLMPVKCNVTQFITT